MNQSNKNKSGQPAQSQNPAKSSRSRRRRRNRGANTPYRSEGVYPSIQAPGVSSGAIQRARLSNVQRMLTSARVTSSGLSFLKCAFAPPDFDQTNVLGVPDKFEGKSLVKKHRLVTAYTVAATFDTYILLAPVPGVAYFATTVAAGAGISATTVFTAVLYSDFASLFGPPGGDNTADVVTKFRYVSNHFELVPTTNQMSWTGNIQSWKLPLAMEVRSVSAPGATPSSLYTVTGLNGCNATNANQYTGPFNLGVYTACYSTGAEFTFNPIIEAQNNLPNDIASSDFAQLNTGGSGCIPGLDSQFDSLVVKISGVGSNTSNTAILKTWACVEYQVLPGSSLYEYSTFSPCDLLAIDLYKKIVNELPVGVAFTDNEGFWRRVLQIIRNMSGGLSLLPGPYGLAASGVHSISTALDTLTL